MKNTYSITGMTCTGCVALVSDKLAKVAGVEKVKVNLEKAEAEVLMAKPISLDDFTSVLPNKYSIVLKGSQSIATATNTIKEKTKLEQLRPLLLIFLYLFSATILLNYKTFDTQSFMFDFMGLFYIVFSFFKFLDLKGFPEIFKMYDPLAKVIPAYGWAYPFIELALGLLFLFRFQVTMALVFTLCILGITTIGVITTLVDKKNIQCACLGTALKLPMTEATLIENSIMLVMAISMLVGLF